jgi:PTS system beta-glucosides-specific IIC component
MAKNYNKMAIDIVREIGGEENVKSLAHCMTRLRFIVKDEKKVNLEALKKAEGVIQVMVAAGQYQVVIGTDVGDVYDEIGKVTNINLTGEADEDGADYRYLR